MSYTEHRGTAGGVGYLILEPPSYTDKLVTYHHGSGEDREDLLDDPNKAGLVTAITDAGYLLASSDAAGNNWGNQAGLDAYTALHSFIVTTYAPRRSAIFAQSMGGLTGWLRASAGSESTLRALFGIFPVCSLADMFDNNNGFLAAEIRAAYGIASNGSDYAALTAGHDPYLKTASTYAGLRTRFYASPSDTIVNKTANSDAMKTLISSYVTESDVVVCSGDHGDASHFQPTDVMSFLSRAFDTPIVIRSGGLSRGL